MIRSAALALVLPLLVAEAEDWPQFRGPAGDGRSSEANLPVTWSERENIRWKVPIPGRGWSSPVIAGGDVWLTVATDGNRSLRLLSLDAGTGRIRTNVEVFRLAAPVAGHEKNSAASPTPIIEGDRVYVHFGSYGTACVRRDGAILWRSQELKFAQVHGPGGSPAMYENLLIVNCDGHDRQFVAALDTNTGKVVWQQPRPSAMAYATPLVIRTPNGAQVVSPGAHRAVSYNPKTGEVLWFVTYGDGFSNVPRPVFAHGLVYVTTGFYTPKLLAVRTEGKGNVSSTHVAWQYERGVPLTSSPVIAGQYLYMVSDNGIATCLNALTGQELWRQRLSGSYSASPVFADGKIWFLSEDGETHVVLAGKEFRRVAVNTLEGRFLASMAVSSGALFLRSDTHLYRISAER
jgi:outer membrane protein assembly factor BamB